MIDKPKKKKRFKVDPRPAERLQAMIEKAGGLDNYLDSATIPNDLLRVLERMANSLPRHQYEKSSGSAKPISSKDHDDT